MLPQRDASIPLLLCLSRNVCVPSASGASALFLVLTRFTDRMHVRELNFGTQLID
jgi:hypothetical protein